MRSNEMNKKRLEHLRDVVVPNIDQEKIRMSNYFSRDSTDDECGTCACLAGHACYDDQFKKEGLYTIILKKDSLHMEVLSVIRQWKSFLVFIARRRSTYLGPTNPARKSILFLGLIVYLGRTHETKNTKSQLETLCPHERCHAERYGGGP